MPKHVKALKVPDLEEMKRRGEKITALTAYDATMAALMDRGRHRRFCWWATLWAP